MKNIHRSTALLAGALSILAFALDTVSARSSTAKFGGQAAGTLQLGPIKPVQKFKNTKPPLRSTPEKVEAGSENIKK